MGVFSNLNLNGGTAIRVQPQLGEWGPADVPTTRAKKRMRIWVSLAFLLALTALTLAGYFFYKQMNG